MADFSAQMDQKKDRTLTPHSFQRLLSWLDEGTHSDGQKYLEMQRRLVAYFDRKNCSNFEELADETLNHVARRLEEEGTIESEAPANYCYLVARFVLMEHLRETQKEKAMVESIKRQHPIQNVAQHHADEREIKGDTGLGEVRNGEGVYGLRRAFVLAGAESLVMSLWPVSDYSTRNLMINYYKNLKLGLGHGAALRQAQLHLLKRNRQLHPFYWANFIQSGEWANLDGKR